MDITAGFHHLLSVCSEALTTALLGIFHLEKEIFLCSDWLKKFLP